MASTGTVWDVQGCAREAHELDPAWGIGTARVAPDRAGAAMHQLAWGRTPAVWHGLMPVQCRASPKMI